MTQENLTQEHLEGSNKTGNFFFNYVKEYSKKNITNDLQKTEEKLDNLLKFGITNQKDFEFAGIFSFLMGMDYSGQSEPQYHIVENARKRFMELNIPISLVNKFCNWINTFTATDSEGFYNLLQEYVTKAQNKFVEKIPAAENITELDLKNIRAKINSFINEGTFHVKYAQSIKKIKSTDYTWENILQLNTLLQEYGVFKGSVVKKLTDVYGSEIFKTLLEKSSTKYNNIKYATLYCESLISLTETALRFKVFVSDENTTEENFDENVEIYENVDTDDCAITTDKIVDTEQEQEYVYALKRYTNEEMKIIMDTQPDKFIELNLEDLVKSVNIDSDEKIVEAINILTEDFDFAQHLYGYMRKMINSEYRKLGENNPTNLLESMITNLTAEYKSDVETICEPIDESQLQRVIELVNETIKTCVLETQDQKQYLVSQLIDNGISTWNHLQQILSVIETCSITGDNVTAYTNLADYVCEKENIKTIFEISSTLSEKELKLSILRIFKDWYNYDK